MSQSPSPTPVAEISKLRKDMEYYENECRRLEALTAQLKVTYGKQVLQLETDNSRLQSELDSERAKRLDLEQKEVAGEYVEQVMRSSLQQTNYTEEIDTLKQKVQDLEGELAIMDRKHFENEAERKIKEQKKKEKGEEETADEGEDPRAKLTVADF